MKDRRPPMNAYSTHKSPIWMSLVILCLLSATVVFADEPGPQHPKFSPPTDALTRRTPDPPPSPQVKPADSPVIGRPDKPTPPQTPKDALWWWISAAILLLLLLFFLFRIHRRRKSTGYVTPRPSRPREPAYPPIDQAQQQPRPNQY